MADAPAIDMRKLLKSLHDTPLDNNGTLYGLTLHDVLVKVYSYLLDVSPDSSGVHWFCEKAEDLTIAAASFLLRLFAYDGQGVGGWKTNFNLCLRGCCECVRSLERIKVESRRTYFGAFPDEALKGFYRVFENWELTTVQGEILNATSRSIELGTVYRVLFNWTIFSDPQVQTFLQSNADSIQKLPTHVASPGTLLLSFYQDARIRQWAQSQISKATVVPIPSNQFVGTYSKVLDTVVDMMSTPATRINPPLALSTDTCVLWSAFHAFLRHVPPESLKSKERTTDIRHVVVGHLHGGGPQFTEVLGSFLLLLKRLGEKFWDETEHEYPQVVFDAVKDNPTFATLLENDVGGERSRCLAWLTEYLHTIRKHSAFPEVLAKVADFLCEEMQHDRFKFSRPFTMNTALLLLNSALRQHHGQEISPADAAARVIDIHSEVIISVALSPTYREENWRNARTSARSLVSRVLATDVEKVSSATKGLCSILAEVSTDRPLRTRIPCFSIRKQMWKKVFPSLQPSDTDGLAAIISAVARAAHFDKLSEKPFLPIFKSLEQMKGYVSPKPAFDAVNDAIETFNDGFLEAVTKFGDYNVSTSGLELLRQPGTAKDVMLLLLSPVERIQAAAKSFISLAFDVDGRQECFRSLLENLPQPAFDGIEQFLTTYMQFTPVVPEACSLSSSLVRCFTDIIEALCASPDGLLRNPSYLRAEEKHGPAARLPQLWTLMTKCLAIIFKRCPSWSVYFENEEMILWMRDALIFGRDMLAQWRVIERAASSQQSFEGSTRSSKLSAVGKKMVNSLQEALPELARWLRLTDEELLHQSFSLIQTLLDIFRDTGIQPSAEGLAKLSKHLESARKNEAKTTTRLDASRLSLLADALADFDDEIEVISVTKKDIKAPKIADGHPEIRKTVPTKNDTIQAQQNRVRGQKTILSRYYTEEDQRRLDASSTIPSLKKVLPASAQVHKAKAGEPKIESKPSSQAPSSSESSDDESDGEEPVGGLSALVKFQKSPLKTRKVAERRQIKTIEIAGVRNAVNERRDRRDREEAARRRALRMKPNLSGLHRALLSWNYDHKEPTPPGDTSKPSAVLDTYHDYKQYLQVFEPLLLMDCWAQICQSKDEPLDTYQIKIAGRGHVDDWIDLEVVLPADVKKEWYLSETDIVLLRNPSIQKCIMAKTRHYRATPNEIQASLRCYIKTGGDPGLHIGATWQLSKIFSLSTIHREYAALMSLPHYDLVDAILNPKLPMPIKVNPNSIQHAMSKYGINEPQAAAILSSLESSGFCLIQGPPGTGKTSTICALVAVFMSRRGRPLPVAETRSPADKSTFAKLLICAPSNAAIDEIAYRIKEGYRGSKRMLDNTKVVRIGTGKAMNPSVVDISLDVLVDQKLNGETSATKEKGLTVEVTNVRQRLEDLKAAKNRIFNELRNIQNDISKSEALESELKRINTQRMSCTQQLDRLKDARKSESRTLDAVRRKARLEVLQEADVICTTLSGAGHEILESLDFDTIIIDEAAQAIELSSLIPLRYKCRRCVMVGDPQQLPPTVISQVASGFHYNQSLFVRLQKQQPEAMQLLSIQYRMHPEISRLPSRLFYQSKLQDGPDMAAKTIQPWHSHPKFGTYKFFNVSGVEEKSNQSLINKTECNVAVALFTRLRREFSSVNLDLRVGIVTMYRAQVAELRRQFERHLGEKLDGKVDFNTVDGFQGQEKDIIILSCVRGGVNQDNVGFLKDTRRINVALTRAKSSLFILGNAATLERSNIETWREIISDARSRSCLLDVDTAFFTMPFSSPSVLEPTKSRKGKPAPPPVLPPSDLVTPQNFKVNTGQTQASSQAAECGIVRNESSIPQNSISESATFERAEGDADHNSQPSQKPSRTVEVPKPTVQGRLPLKRAKEPQSIFIPKKKQRS